MSIYRNGILFVVALVLSISFESATWAQFFPGDILPSFGRRPPSVPPAASAPMDPDKKSEGDEEVVTIPRDTTPLHPRQIRLHLLDGSIIAGELSVDNIAVETEFGVLTVPVEKIRSFKPGLDSYPEKGKQIEILIENLGSEDYQTREQSHKELLNFGLKIEKELELHSDDGNAERKRHLDQLRKEIAELAEEREFSDFDDENQADRPWIRGDTIVTTEFTIVGTIQTKTFEVTSKYGPLTVKLSDVQTGDRQIGTKESVRKALTVSGSNLIQRGMKSTGIRVEKGDKITVRADGQIVMTPWGGNYSSNPDGGTYYGWYVPNEIPGGALVAKIGKSGKETKVGARKTFIATSSGLLQFGIAMMPDYANEGYNFPGQYNVSVKIEPR